MNRAGYRQGLAFRTDPGTAWLPLAAKHHTSATTFPCGSRWDTQNDSGSCGGSEGTPVSSVRLGTALVRLPMGA